jgi:integrase
LIALAADMQAACRRVSAAVAGSCPPDSPLLGTRGDTKTRTSRRTLGLPHLAVTALHALHAESAPVPGDLVFCTATGQPLDAANVRRFFRAVCTAAGIGPGWTPRELRHTFVSLMSDRDVAVEEIARLVGPRQ